MRERRRLLVGRDEEGGMATRGDWTSVASAWASADCGSVVGCEEVAT